jgi:arsenate reductase (thioredoxin)
MTETRRFNILFLCTGNTARSIMCEAALNWLAPARFQAFSAGSFPKGEIHPLTVEALKAARIPLPQGARSKSWDEFAAPGAPKMDFVITVCDAAKGEVCPVWPGQPLQAHWGYPDPAAAEGTEEQRLKAFKNVLHAIRYRLDIFSNLKLERLSRLALQEKLDEIGRTDTKADA